MNQSHSWKADFFSASQDHLPFMEPKNSLSYSQKPVTGLFLWQMTK